MYDIQSAFVADVAGGEARDSTSKQASNNYRDENTFQDSAFSAFADADSEQVAALETHTEDFSANSVRVEEALEALGMSASVRTSSTSLCPAEQPQQRQHVRVIPHVAVTVAAAHVPFMGYLDEDGVVHSSKLSNKNENADQKAASTRRDNDCQHKMHKTSLSLSSTENNSSEEEMKEMFASVEEILERSIDFERSHSVNRLSSSLDNLCHSSSSNRHLYPNVEDVSGRNCHSDSVCTTVSGVMESASTGAIKAASFLEGTKVPEPPGTVPVAFPATLALKTDNSSTNEDGNQDKAGIARIEGCSSEPPAYAVAALEDIRVSSAEATVLETSQTPEDKLMRKLEADDAELIALKQSIDIRGRLPPSLLSRDPQATVVAISEYTVHPSDLSATGAVQAELIREDYHNPAPAIGLSAASGSAVASMPLAFSDNHSYGNEQTAPSEILNVEEPDYAVVESEATVIVREAPWYHPAEAIVMGEDTSIPYLERKLPARLPDNPIDVTAVAQSYADFTADFSNAHPQSTVAYGQSAGAAFADEEAEVLDITEEYHPAEVTGNEVQAELVALADDTNSRATAGSSAHCATAMLGANAPSLSDFSDGVQAATVLGYEDEDETRNNSTAISRASSLGAPTANRVYPGSPVSRTSSAPFAVGTRIPLNEAVGSAVTQEALAELETVVEEGWMHRPSFNGKSSVGVTAIPPPRDGEDEQFDTASSHDVRATAEQAAALDAFSTRPTQDFDCTDCRVVNCTSAMSKIFAGESSAASSAIFGSAPAVPPPRSFNSTSGQDNSGGGDSDGVSFKSAASSRGGLQKITTHFARGMEMLFGKESDETIDPTMRERTKNSVANSVIPRELLPWSVIHSEATNHWVATVNTNQKALDSKNVLEASKSLRAFSVVTEKQAKCLARAWSPPRMHEFKKNPACTICSSKFAVFRRACHCRNCGICVCTACVVNWPAKMVPETYNIKKESFVNICKACDWLCTSFRVALLEGDRDQAIALHATGNVNLVTPFANVKGELL